MEKKQSLMRELRLIRKEMAELFTRLENREISAKEAKEIAEEASLKLKLINKQLKELK